MKQCLFSIICLFSTFGLFAVEPLESSSTRFQGTSTFINPKEMVSKGVQAEKGGHKGDRFNPAFKQASLLLTDPATLPDEAIVNMPGTGYPYLVPLRTPSAASEDVIFHPSTSTFTIKKSGTYYVEYFVKLFGLDVGMQSDRVKGLLSAGTSFSKRMDIVKGLLSSDTPPSGQLGVAINVNDHFVGEAKIPVTRSLLGGSFFEGVTPSISGSRLIFLPLEKGDTVSLYLITPPGGTSSTVLFFFGDFHVGRDVDAYLKLKKIS